MGKLASFQHIFEENAPEHFCKEDDNIMAHDENHLHFDVYTWRCLCIELRLMCVWSGLLMLFCCCCCVNVCVANLFSFTFFVNRQAILAFGECSLIFSFWHDSRMYIFIMTSGCCQKISNTKIHTHTSTSYSS